MEQTKLTVAAEAIRLANETRRAWLSAVSAQQTVQYMEEVKVAAEAGAELARRMARVGNFSKLAQAREQVFYAEATAQLARAKQSATAERERLSRLMGLWGDALAFTLPERLPDLPTAADERADAEARGMATRLDLQASRRDLEGLARNLGLTKTTRFINVLEFGPARVTETPGPRKKGYEIGLEIPLFDWGGARVAKAEAIYMQAAHRMAETAVTARSEVREAYTSYRTAFDLAKHYRDEIVPLRKKISEENLLRYNGMLIGVFELLADAREQVGSVNAYIEALREFWLAEADLQLAMNGKPGGTTAGKATTKPAAEVMTKPAGH
jgi:outer membrane protein TolC